MKPTCMFASKSWPGVARCRLVLLVLFENGLCDAGGCHRGWPSGVEGQVRDDFADLVLGHAVGQRASDVAAELLGAVESCQHRDSNKTAVALGEAGTFPDITKENLVRDIHQFRHHGAKCFPRIRCRHVDSSSMRVRKSRATRRVPALAGMNSRAGMVRDSRQSSAAGKASSPWALRMKACVPPSNAKGKCFTFPRVSPFSGGACPALRGVVAAPFFHLSARLDLLCARRRLLCSLRLRLR